MTTRELLTAAALLRYCVRSLGVKHTCRQTTKEIATALFAAIAPPDGGGYNAEEIDIIIGAVYGN